MGANVGEWTIVAHGAGTAPFVATFGALWVVRVHVMIPEAEIKMIAPRTLQKLKAAEDRARALEA